ncbi:hypothetical protein BGZ94_000885 [Podila epigama]|nr:hypothetical protein BGZ94_000885 [Podila epigama]
MKLNIAIVLATVATLLSVSAAPAAVAEEGSPSSAAAANAADGPAKENGAAIKDAASGANVCCTETQPNAARSDVAEMIEQI